MIFGALTLLTGCDNLAKLGGTNDTVTVYFYNAQNNTLEGEVVGVNLEENAPSDNKMYAVLEALYAGPQVGKQAAKPIDYHIEEASLKENIAFITFDETYRALDVQTQIVNRASLVWSLTELDFIEGVEFFVGDEVLKTSTGNKVGKVTRKDILMTVLNPKPPTSTQTIKLYFAKAGDDKLYKEERKVSVNNNTPLEHYVIEELIKGPTTEGLLPTLPPDTKVNDIKEQEQVCQVDLSYDLKTSQVTSPLQESLVLYSIVNSLTEISRIQKVLFLKDGNKQTEFAATITTGGIFERNEEIIADTP